MLVLRSTASRHLEDCGNLSKRPRRLPRRRRPPDLRCRSFSCLRRRGGGGGVGRPEGGGSGVVGWGEVGGEEDGELPVVPEGDGRV
jgi:hypothetical protein